MKLIVAFRSFSKAPKHTHTHTHTHITYSETQWNIKSHTRNIIHAKEFLHRKLLHFLTGCHLLCQSQLHRPNYSTSVPTYSTRYNSTTPRTVPYRTVPYRTVPAAPRSMICVCHRAPCIITQSTGSVHRGLSREMIAWSTSF